MKLKVLVCMFSMVFLDSFAALESKKEDVQIEEILHQVGDTLNIGYDPNAFYVLHLRETLAVEMASPSPDLEAQNVASRASALRKQILAQKKTSRALEQSQLREWVMHEMADRDQKLKNDLSTERRKRLTALAVAAITTAGGILSTILTYIFTRVEHTNMSSGAI